MFGSNLIRSNQREGGWERSRWWRAGAVLVVRGRFLGAGVNAYVVSDGFLLSLSMCKRGFHDLLNVRSPSHPPVSLPRPAPFPIPLTASSQLWEKKFPYLYPSTPILGITSTLYAYEDGMASKFRNVGTKSSDAGRLPKTHNTAFNTRWKFEIKIKLKLSRKFHLFIAVMNSFVAGKTHLTFII